MLVATAPPFSQPSVQSDTRELERLETVWNEAHEHGYADALDALWVDDMEIAVPKMPVMSKADALKFARSGRMKFLHYQTSDIHVRVYGDAAGRYWPAATNSLDERARHLRRLAIHQELCSTSGAMACRSDSYFGSRTIMISEEAVSRLLLGVICGLAFGIVDVGIMLPMGFFDKRAAMTAAFIARFGIGSAIGAACPDGECRRDSTSSARMSRPFSI